MARSQGLLLLRRCSQLNSHDTIVRHQQDLIPTWRGAIRVRIWLHRGRTIPVMQRVPSIKRLRRGYTIWVKSELLLLLLLLLLMLMVWVRIVVLLVGRVSCRWRGIGEEESKVVTLDDLGH